MGMESHLDPAPVLLPLRRYRFSRLGLKNFPLPSCGMVPSMAVSRSGSQPGARDRAVESWYDPYYLR